MTIRNKYFAREIRVYILVSRVINGDIWLHDLGRLDVSYH